MLEEIVKKLNNFILEYKENIDMPVIVVDSKHILDVIKTLYEEFNFKMLVDLTAVDWLNKRDKRFEVVYHLRNLDENKRIRIKIQDR